MHKFLLSLELFGNRRLFFDSIIYEYYGIDIAIQERKDWGFGYVCDWCDGLWEYFKLGPITIAFGWRHSFENYSDTYSLNRYPTDNWIKRMRIIDKLFNIFRLGNTQ